MDNPEIIRAEGLWFSYDEGESYALSDVSLTIRKGQKVALMGANGSGKSTFSLCCTGICRPRKGKLFFDGREVAYDRKSLLALRSKVGIVFQDPDNQLFSASVFQEISFGPMNMGVSPQQARAAVEDVIDKLAITAFRHKPTHELSGGQKKLVSIADILVMQPQVMILDEPAAALDPKHAGMVNRIVEEMTDNGITVILITHDADYAYRWADEVILFHEGRVLCQGSPEAVFSQKEALETTNLEMPAVLALYERLQQRGVIAPDLPSPRTLEELESYIVNR